MTFFYIVYLIVALSFGFAVGLERNFITGFLSAILMPLIIGMYYGYIVIKCDDEIRRVLDK